MVSVLGPKKWLDDVGGPEYGPDSMRAQPTKQDIQELICKFLESNDLNYHSDGDNFTLPYEELYRILNDVIATRAEYETLLHITEHVPIVQAALRARSFIADFTAAGLRPKSSYPETYEDEQEPGEPGPKMPVIIFPMKTGGPVN